MRPQTSFKTRIGVFITILTTYIVLSLLWPGKDPAGIDELLFTGSFAALGGALLWPLVVRIVWGTVDKVSRR